MKIINTILAVLMVPVWLSAQNCELDLLVAYTPNATTQANGEESIVQEIIRAVELINTSMTNSHITVRVHLTRTIELSEGLSGSITDHLNGLQQPGDGIYDEVDILRERYKADMVLLVAEDLPNQVCGVAAPLEDSLVTANTAFAVVQYKCIYYNMSLARQIGILHGCGYELDSSARFDYGHGYSYYSNFLNYRTIMTVSPSECIGGPDDYCDLIPFWSNPNISLGGAPALLADYHNNALVISEQAPTLANFRLVPDVNGISDVVANYDLGHARALGTLSNTGNYHVRDTAYVTFKARSRIVLEPGFIAEEGTYFAAYIDPSLANCPYVPPSGAARKGHEPELLVENTQEAELFTVYPNPAKYQANFRYQVNKDNTRVSLKVYDLKGMMVAELVSGEVHSSGQYTVRWDAPYDLPKNIYICKIVIGSETALKKLLLIRE